MMGRMRTRSRSMGMLAASPLAACNAQSVACSNVVPHMRGGVCGSGDVVMRVPLMLAISNLSGRAI